MSGLMGSLKEFSLLFRNPRLFARRRTVGTRAFFHKVFAYSQFGEYKERRRLGVEAARFQVEHRIPETLGYLQASFLDRSLVGRAVDAAREVFAATDVGALENKAGYPHLHLIDLLPHLSPKSPFVRLGLDPALLALLSDYFGMLPVLHDITIWYSPNRENVPNSSQYFHLDGQDTRTILLLVCLEDVDEDSGPLTFLPADVSWKIATQLKYRKTEEARRISDEVVAPFLTGPGQTHRMTGKAGSAMILDTDRCFHFGSRAAQKKRLLLGYHYYTPFAFVLPRKFSKGLPMSSLGRNAEFTPIERAVLGAS
jgi:hypothetical protein